MYTISNDELTNITGGGWGKRVVKFAAKRLTGPLGTAWTAYDAVDGYLTAREEGKSVPESLKEGAINAI